MTPIDPNLRSIEAPDEGETAWEALREECMAEFEDWQRADYEAREFEDFANWLYRKASWNAPNKYGEAMNWRERAFKSDAELLRLSQGHRVFDRLERRTGGRA